MAAKDKPIETFTCFAASMGTGRAGVIEITINRWSTDEEREMLLTTLQEKGPRRAAGRAREDPAAGGLHAHAELASATTSTTPATTPSPTEAARWSSRPTAASLFGEAANSTRSMEYQFTLIEIHIDKDGKGEGKMVPAAKVELGHED